MGIAGVFTLAGLISAYTGSAYSAWVKSVYAENNQIARVQTCVQACEANREPGVDCMSTCEVSAHKAWYEENVALTKYADRQWWIWGLMFPSSMIVAVVVSMTLGLLPGMDPSRVFGGAMILFAASAVVAIVMIVLQQLAFLPAVAAYAFLLARTSTVMTGNSAEAPRVARPFTFRLLLLCIPAGIILGGVVELLLPSFRWFAGIEVAWAIVFGASLVPAQDLT